MKWVDSYVTAVFIFKQVPNEVHKTII